MPKAAPPRVQANEVTYGLVNRRGGQRFARGSALNHQLQLGLFEKPCTARGG